MRLSERKIQYLAGKLAAWLQEESGVETVAGGDVLARELAAVMRRDFLREEELDRDVEKTLLQYRKQIDSQNLDVELLRQKIRKQLARERGLVL